MLVRQLTIPVLLLCLQTGQTILSTNQCQPGPYNIYPKSPGMQNYQR